MRYPLILINPYFVSVMNSLIVIADLSDSVGPDVRAMLMDNAQLGRLKFSLYDGLDQKGNVENLTIFGGRSVSIFRQAVNLVL